MSEVKRYQAVPENEFFSGMVVKAEDFDAALAREAGLVEWVDNLKFDLAALREELAVAVAEKDEKQAFSEMFYQKQLLAETRMKNAEKRLTAAEQRNAELASAMEMMAENSDDGDVVEICRHHLANNNPTESGASE